MAHWRLGVAVGPVAVASDGPRLASPVVLLAVADMAADMAAATIPVAVALDFRSYCPCLALAAARVDYSRF
jgi:hypothetical protein